MGIRSFLAFELPSGIKSEVFRISAGVKKTGLEAGWVKPENIHLTMVFMGERKDREIPAIISCTDSALKDITPFKIALGKMGVFPDIRRPRVLWLGLNGEIERLSALRDSLQKPVFAFGVEQEDRPFSPHLTLGRFHKQVRDAALLKRVIDQYRDITGPVERLENLVLFKSDLGPGGPVYTKIHTWPLA